MKRLFLLFAFIFSTTLVFCQTPSCEQFKNGKFKISDQEMGDTRIERKGDKQIEFNEQSQMKLELKVKWLDPCTYTLTLKKILANPNHIDLPKDMILTVKIIATSEKGYLQRSTSNISDQAFEMELIKIE